MTKVKCNEKGCKNNKNGLCPLKEISLYDSDCQSYVWKG